MTKQTKSASFAELIQAAASCADGIADDWETNPIMSRYSLEDPKQVAAGIRRLEKIASQMVLPELDNVDGAWVARMLTEHTDLAETSIDGPSDVITAIYWAVLDCVGDEASKHLMKRANELTQASPSP